MIAPQILVAQGTGDKGEGMTRSAKLALGVAGAAAIMLVGGLAYAAIPDANQVIHGCYNAGGGEDPEWDPAQHR